MAKLSMTGCGDASEIAGLLIQELEESALSCTLVDSVTRNAGDTTIIIMVFEKYYWRASNRASLTVVVSGENGFIAVDAIGSAGGQGAIFKLSWGAEEDFVGVVGQILEARGFRY